MGKGTLITTGCDSFGPFAVEQDDPREQEQCIACGTPMPIKLTYFLDYPQLPKGIRIRDTVLGTADSAIGVSCGCYAKLHRQVAHIGDRMKARKK